MIPLQENDSSQTVGNSEFLRLTSVLLVLPGENSMKLSIVLLLAAISVGCGYSPKPTTPQQPGTTPTITQLVPPSTAAGSSQFTLEVDGTNFGGQAFVTFGGVKMTTTPVSATKVMATIPPTAVMNSGTAAVTVTNPGTPGGQYGGGTAAATSTAMNFTIN
jgi:hypothetical protein